MGQLFAIDFYIDLVIANGTKAIKIGSSNGWPFSINSACFSMEHIAIAKNTYASFQTFCKMTSR